MLRVGGFWGLSYEEKGGGRLLRGTCTAARNTTPGFCPDGPGFGLAVVYNAHRRRPDPAVRYNTEAVLGPKPWPRWGRLSWTDSWGQDQKRHLVAIGTETRNRGRRPLPYPAQTQIPADFLRRKDKSSLDTPC